jgi:hypothetical protein
MFRRTVAVAALVLSFAVPARAEEGLGVATQLAGVTSASDSALATAQQVLGACWYLGQTTVSGLMDFRYGGSAVATSAGIAQPQITDVKCTLISPAQGVPGEEPTRTASFDAACPLGSCTANATVAGWPVRVTVICVDGSAVFGPVPAKTVSIVHACRTSSL